MSLGSLSIVKLLHKWLSIFQRDIHAKNATEKKWEIPKKALGDKRERIEGGFLVVTWFNQGTYDSQPGGRNKTGL
jgi:hypothetical protein